MQSVINVIASVTYWSMLVPPYNIKYFILIRITIFGYNGVRATGKKIASQVDYFFFFEDFKRWERLESFFFLSAELRSVTDKLINAVTNPISAEIKVRRSKVITSFLTPF